MNSNTVAAGRFCFDHDPGTTWPASGFGQSWNGFAAPHVDRDTLIAVLATVVADPDTNYRAFAVHEDNTAALIDDLGAVDRIEAHPDSGLYDLAVLGWTLWTVAS